MWGMGAIQGPSSDLLDMLISPHNTTRLTGWMHCNGWGQFSALQGNNVSHGGQFKAQILTYLICSLGNPCNTYQTDRLNGFKCMSLTPMRPVEAHRTIRAAKPNPPTASLSSSLSHCITLKEQLLAPLHLQEEPQISIQWPYFLWIDLIHEFAEKSP